jgi:hypothetical protein
VFVSSSGTSFDPHRDLPKDTRIVYKEAALAASDESGLMSLGFRSPRKNFGATCR